MSRDLHRVEALLLERDALLSALDASRLTVGQMQRELERLREIIRQFKSACACSADKPCHRCAEATFARVP